MSVERDANVELDEMEMDEGEEMEIVVEITDDQQIALTAGEWSIVLSIEEARDLGEALIETADDIDRGVE
jgi:predicted regulator of Ras-like GTPase activity (Roadblock/LC7/MglB family)